MQWYLNGERPRGYSRSMSSRTRSNVQRSVEKKLARLRRLKEVEAIAVEGPAAALPIAPRYDEFGLYSAEETDRDGGAWAYARRGANHTAGDDAAGLRGWTDVQLDFQLVTCFVCCGRHGSCIVESE